MSVPVLSPHAALAERIIGNIVQASSPAVSPDGSQVAFVVTRVDAAKNKYFSQVWLATTDGTTPRHRRRSRLEPDLGARRRKPAVHLAAQPEKG
jgi:dipeptidyl aminopeptidase/acylaminoacyl peptidase